jgi:hypothetical protein
MSPIAKDSHKINSSQIIETSREHAQKKKKKLDKPAYMDMSNVSGSGLGTLSNFAAEVMFQGNLVS